jgi:hypothetical protein
MATIAQHYKALFARLEGELGALGEETSTGIIGFSAGGPVSVRSIAGRDAFVTCELSLYPEQIASAEGENFELLTRLPLTDSQAQALLTALGNLSTHAKLGHRHTIDVAGVSGTGGLSVIRLSHYSSAVVDGRLFGIYEVHSHQGGE